MCMCEFVYLCCSALYDREHQQTMLRKHGHGELAVRFLLARRVSESVVWGVMRQEPSNRKQKNADTPTAVR